MNKGVLFSKNYIVNEYFLKVTSELHLNLNEFIILMFFINDDNKKFDVDVISSKLFINNESVLNAINSLVEKGLISLNSQKDESGKLADYIKIDGLEVLINEDLNASSNNKEKLDIYTMFEKQFGRTISSMEYEIINAWFDKGFSEEIILAALKEAVYNGVTNLRYIDKILFEWKKNGINNVDDVEQHLKKRNKTNKTGNDPLFDYDWIDDETE